MIGEISEHLEAFAIPQGYVLNKKPLFNALLRDFRFYTAVKPFQKPLLTLHYPIWFLGKRRIVKSLIIVKPGISPLLRSVTAWLQGSRPCRLPRTQSLVYLGYGQLYVQVLPLHLLVLLVQLLHVFPEQVFMFAFQVCYVVDVVQFSG